MTDKNTGSKVQSTVYLTFTSNDVLRKLAFFTKLRENHLVESIADSFANEYKNMAKEIKSSVKMPSSSESMPKKEKIRKNLLFSPNTDEQLRERAFYEKRSISDVVEQLLESYRIILDGLGAFESDQAFKQIIKEAIAEPFLPSQEQLAYMQLLRQTILGAQEIAQATKIQKNKSK